MGFLLALALTGRDAFLTHGRSSNVADAYLSRHGCLHWLRRKHSRTVTDRVYARVVRTSGTGNLTLSIHDANGVFKCSGGTVAPDLTAQCVVGTATGSVRVNGSGIGTAGSNSTRRS